MWKISKQRCIAEINKFYLLNTSFNQIVIYYLKDYNKKFPKNNDNDIIGYISNKGEVEKCYRVTIDSILFNCRKKDFDTQNQLINYINLNYRNFHFSNGSSFLIDFYKITAHQHGLNENDKLVLFNYFLTIHIHYYDVLYNNLIKYINIKTSTNKIILMQFANHKVHSEEFIRQLN